MHKFGFLKMSMFKILVICVVFAVSSARNVIEIQNASTKALIDTAQTDTEKFYLKLNVNELKKQPKASYTGRWIIKKFSKSVCQLKLDFKKFGIASSVNCVTDFLQITSGKYNQVFCGMMDGKQEKIYWPQGSNEITLLFHSTNVDTITDIQILVTQTLNSCKNYFSYTQFYLQSQGFSDGLTYPKNTLQEVFVVRNNSAVCQLQMEINVFDIQPPNYSSSGDESICINDLFMIGDLTRKSLMVRCGSYPKGVKWTMQWPNTKNVSVIPIQFVSGDKGNLKGFNMILTQGECK